MTIKGYRKFGLTVGVIVIATGLVIWGKITADNFVDLVKWVTGLFLGANVVQAVGVKAAEKTQVGVTIDGNLTSQSQP